MFKGLDVFWVHAMTDTSEKLEAAFRRFVCQTSSEPLGIVVSRACGTTLWDNSGREYLDLLSGIGVANVGHCNPEVVAAVKEQADRYLHVMVYGEGVLEPQVVLAQRLAELSPGDLSVTYFTNSGAEAIEGTIKLARKYTGRSGMVGFQGSFHGDTMGAVPPSPAVPTERSRTRYPERSRWGFPKAWANRSSLDTEGFSHAISTRGSSS